MHILIAQDDEVSRKILLNMLENAGYRVTTTDNGYEAWELLQKNSYSLVIADYSMKGMGGIQLCQEVRGHKKHGYIYVIIVTDRDKKNDITEAMNAGSDDCITKPYEKVELFSRILAGTRILSLEKELRKKNKALSRANKAMQNDLLAASRLQKSFLPKKAPQVPGLEFAWFFKPCEMIAGDTFHCFKLDDEYVAFYLLDVSGHGVPAAMLSVMLSRTLTPYSYRGGILIDDDPESGKFQIRSPQEIAGLLNNSYPMDEDVGQYFTLLYALLHTPSLTLRLVSAGHPHPLHLKKNGDTQFIKTDGFPIGMFENIDYEEGHLSLSPGESIFLYSDGVIDAVNRRNEIYGPAGLLDSITKRRKGPISKITKGILSDVVRFTKGTEIRDDMTLLALSIGL
jgi:sigma-B regulation protein RsbU (phosphoserine phosphatase)